MSVIVLLLGCAQTSGGGSTGSPGADAGLDSHVTQESPATPPDTSAPSVPTGDTAPGATGDTAGLGSTAHTGTLETADTGRPVPTGVRPHTVFVGPNLQWPVTAGRVGVGRVDVISASVHDEETRGIMVLLEGTPGGQVSYADAEIARLTRCGDDDRAAGGDTDGDGHGDFWGGGHLFLGPLAGSHECDDAAHAWFDGSAHMVGDFDANGDGYADLVSFSSPSNFFVRYGPFAPGRIPLASEPEFTGSAGWLWGCEQRGMGWLLPDLAGPGTFVVAAGQHSDPFYCPMGRHTRLVDITGPPGQVWTADDEFAWDDFTLAAALGDWDGDGHTDIVNQYQPYPGPVVGSGSEWVEMFDPEAEGPSIFYIEGAVDDVNGDGVREILHLVPETRPDETGWFVLLSGTVGREPFSNEMAATVAVPLAYDGDVSRLWRARHPATGDFDGDGLGDLALAVPGSLDEPEDAIFVWRGADLLAYDDAE